MHQKLNYFNIAVDEADDYVDDDIEEQDQSEMGMKALLGGNEEGDEDDYYDYDEEEY